MQWQPPRFSPGFTHDANAAQQKADRHWIRKWAPRHLKAVHPVNLVHPVFKASPVLLHISRHVFRLSVGVSMKRYGERRTARRHCRCHREVLASMTRNVALRCWRDKTRALSAEMRGLADQLVTDPAPVVGASQAAPTVRFA